MLTKKFVAVLAVLVVLAFVVSAGGDSNEKSIPAILDKILAELSSIRTDLSVIRGKLEVIQVSDLVPLASATSSHPEGDFCRGRIDAQGRLHVFAYNQGAGTAGPSQTQVYFRVPKGAEGQKSCGDGCAQVDVFTPTLTAARSPQSIIDLVMDIPEGCFGSAFGPDDINNCQFKVAVDATNAVSESNELNNNAGGACQGLV